MLSGSLEGKVSAITVPFVVWALFASASNFESLKLAFGLDDWCDFVVDASNLLKVESSEGHCHCSN